VASVFTVSGIIDFHVSDVSSDIEVIFGEKVFDSESDRGGKQIVRESAGQA
jgi:hypothetical protein